ncbi:hypothetical protein ACFX2A_000399 [Malus domestica]|uniref:RING-type E3 ubiquitin transferase n=1 Tax=Malus domestica TaxID=3750 RepID=A0A498KS35_MALDO|nr:hypothetical protein DVH24_014419 [Malus domestica]
MSHHMTWIFNLLFLFLIAYPTPANAQTAEFHNNGYGYTANLNSSMAVVIVFLVFAFFLMGFLSIYIRRCAESTDMESARTRAPAAVGASSRRGLDPAVIQTFPILVYSAVKDLKIGKGALECAVCLSEFDDFETMRLLPKCDHVFHPDCIDAWLAAHMTCPVCRANLTCAESNSRATELNANLNPEDSSSRSPIEIREVPKDAVVLIVDENQRGGAEAVEVGDPRRRSGKFLPELPRSHSTGHSLIRPGLDTERYTLRLPEKVRRQVVSSGNGKLTRSTSYDIVLRRLGSSRKGYRYGGGEGNSSVDNQTSSTRGCC